jgi:hypothetical protein
MERLTRLKSCFWLVLLPLFLPVFLPAATWGEESAAVRRALAHAAAGEFGPARALASQLGDMPDRDRVLAQIAVLQARHGGMAGAATSLHEIRSDQQRTDAIETIVRAPAAHPRGGAAMADFDSLIDLITATVAPNSWIEAGGEGTIESFPTGVLVDAAGLMRRVAASSKQLDLVRRESARASDFHDVTRNSALRKVSLTRLERATQIAWLEGRPPDETMRHLAGLYRVEYVLIYPETGDVVLAGPAGDWLETEEGWTVHRETRSPTLRLDDLVVLLRQADRYGGPFGCAIKPRRENLERTQQVLKRSSRQPLRISRRAAWLDQLRESVGRQDIEVFGIDPHSRAARILVEADYHMKLIGIGLEEGTLGVPSYLDLLAERGGAQPELEVLRWWFAMHYDAVRANSEETAFQFVGQGAKLLSENELLTERGERVQTGKAEQLNRTFAANFTRHFERLAEKYPIYAELRNVFDLALVAHLIRHQGLADQVEWQLAHWSHPERFPVAREPVPREVDSVANYHKTGRSVLTVVVAGGAHAEPQKWLAADVRSREAQGQLGYLREESAAQPQMPRHVWWWD